MASTLLLSGVGDVADRYDSLLLDQFGVLHDGRVAYPAAVEAVRRLAAAGKRLVVLSNSGRRATDTLAKLQPLGFDPSWFAGAVTSGETTHRALEARTDPAFAALGPHCLHLTWGERGAINVDGLGLTHVTDPEQADFVLAHGMEVVSRGYAAHLRGGYQEPAPRRCASSPAVGHRQPRHRDGGHFQAGPDAGRMRRLLRRVRRTASHPHGQACTRYLRCSEAAVSRASARGRR